MTKHTLAPKSVVVKESLLKLALYRFLYSAGFLIFSLFYLPTFFIKGKHKAGTEGRFGRVPEDLKRKMQKEKIVWVHAVSVGEMAQAIRLGQEIKDRFQSCRILFTATTPAGAELCRQLKSEEDYFLFFPVDFKWSVRRFLGAVRPEAVIFLETEIWPNLVFELEKQKIPLFILNGRISDKALPKYLKIPSFTRIVLKRFAQIGAQDELMRARFLSLGVPAEKCRVTGNIKYDWEPAHVTSALLQHIQNYFRKPGHFLWVAGSTHEGEEELLMEAYLRLRESLPSLRLLIAPRHLTRLEKIEAAARKLSLPAVRLDDKTDWKAAPTPDKIYILNKIGVLAQVYEWADVVFIGGSLVPTGGHNLVEPAYFAKPILYGPFMANFKEMEEEFRSHEAAVRVPNADELRECVLNWAKDNASRDKTGAAARALVQKHAGATKRNLQLLADYLEDVP